MEGSIRSIRLVYVGVPIGVGFVKAGWGPEMNRVYLVYGIGPYQFGGFDLGSLFDRLGII